MFRCFHQRATDQNDCGPRTVKTGAIPVRYKWDYGASRSGLPTLNKHRAQKKDEGPHGTVSRHKEAGEEATVVLRDGTLQAMEKDIIASIHRTIVQKEYEHWLENEPAQYLNWLMICLQGVSSCIKIIVYDQRISFNGLYTWVRVNISGPW